MPFWKNPPEPTWRAKLSKAIADAEYAGVTPDAIADELDSHTAILRRTAALNWTPNLVPKNYSATRKANLTSLLKRKERHD
jgi:hypothetical protein